MSTVSIIGLGAMGQALAACFLRQKHAVTVWNRTPGKAISLLAQGAQEAETAADAVAASELTVMCVLDYAAADSVVGGAGSVLSGRMLVNLTNGTPSQARTTSELVTSFGAHYLDGGIMATPSMIGGEHAFILYSGSQTVFDTHGDTLRELGEATYVDTDAGFASLYDLALLSGMYGLFAGFLHASALVKSEGIQASRFLSLLEPWLTAMTGALPDLAEKIDRRVHNEDVASNLGMQVAAIENILVASREQGIAIDLLDPMQKLMRQRVADGFGEDEISGIFELIRRGGGIQEGEA